MDKLYIYPRNHYSRQHKCLLDVYVERPGRETDNSLPSSADVKNMNWWPVELNNGHVFMAWYLVKHKDDFTLPYVYVEVTNTSGTNTRMLVINTPHAWMNRCGHEIIVFQ
jgi:hypothetical protein